jgi:hypothetical protein
VSIGPIIGATLPYLRGQAGSMMFETCLITRLDPTAVPVMDQTTGVYTTPPPAIVYSGPCRVKGNTRFDKVVEAGEQPITHYRFTVSVPVTSVTFQVDDTVHVTSSQLDPAMAGLTLRVREPEFGSQITARRLGCELNAG